MILRAVRFVVRRGVKLSLFASALALGGLLANGIISDPIRGSGKAASENRAMEDVTEVIVSSECAVKIVAGAIPSLKASADDNVLPLLETKISSGKLTLSTQSGHSIHPVTPIVYTLVVPRLEKLTVTGYGNVRASGIAGELLAVKLSGAGNISLDEIDCTSLTLNLSGAGSATLAGKVNRLELRLSGAGEIDAEQLQTATTEANISGCGNAKVWATDRLKAKISGAGDIQYKGSPTLERRVSGCGSIKVLGA